MAGEVSLAATPGVLFLLVFIISCAKSYPVIEGGELPFA